MEGYYLASDDVAESTEKTVMLTGKDSHAWVEVYDPVIGWYPVDVTPSSTETEDVTNFWDEFADFMDGGEEQGDVTTQQTNAFTISDSVLRAVLYGLIIIVAGVVVFLFGRRFFLWLLFYIRFVKASYNDKLILFYSRMVQWYGKRHAEFMICKNYEDQIKYIIAHMEREQAREELESQAGQIIKILNIAGFSNQSVDESVYKKTQGYLKKLWWANRK